MGEWSFRKLLAGLAALRPRDSSLQFELQPQLAADGFNVGLCLLKAGSLPFKLGHPSAILNLPALVSRMPPKTSSIKPSSISRALCSDGIRCIKPLAPSRNETNSSRVNGCLDGAILGICACGRLDQAGFGCHCQSARWGWILAGSGCWK